MRVQPALAPKTFFCPVTLTVEAKVKTALKGIPRNQVVLSRKVQDRAILFMPKCWHKLRFGPKFGHKLSFGPKFSETA